MDSSILPSTSSICICTSSSKSTAISSTPSEAMPTPSYRPPARGFHIGPFGLIAALLLLFCWDDSLLPLANAQSELAPSFASAHPPSPTSVSLVMVAPSADSPTALVPSGGIPSDFPISDWHHFPYGRTNYNQQQQQQQTGI
uniref:Secreted protein n=1 Tax=Globodera pallida TaxID=36090 RepID=A0A183BHT8_GLOPA